MEGEILGYTAVLVAVLAALALTSLTLLVSLFYGWRKQRPTSVGQVILSCLVVGEGLAALFAAHHLPARFSDIPTSRDAAREWVQEVIVPAVVEGLKEEMKKAPSSLLEQILGN